MRSLSTLVGFLFLSQLSLAHGFSCRSGLRDLKQVPEGFIKIFTAQDRTSQARACKLAYYMCEQYNLHFYQRLGRCSVLGAFAF